MLEHSLLHRAFQMTQYIAAKNRIHAFHEGHLSIAEQVNPAKLHSGINLETHFQLISCRDEVGLPEMKIHRSRAL